MDINKVTKKTLLGEMQKEKTKLEIDPKDHSKEIHKIENDIALIGNAPGDNILEIRNNISDRTKKTSSILSTTLELFTGVACAFGVAGLITSNSYPYIFHPNRTIHMIAACGGIAAAVGIYKYLNSFIQDKKSIQYNTTQALDTWTDYLKNQPCTMQNQLNISFAKTG